MKDDPWGTLDLKKPPPPLPVSTTTKPAEASIAQQQAEKQQKPVPVLPLSHEWVIGQDDMLAYYNWYYHTHTPSLLLHFLLFFFRPWVGD